MEGNLRNGRKFKPGLIKLEEIAVNERKFKETKGN